jgi:hypothetical protein
MHIPCRKILKQSVVFGVTGTRPGCTLYWFVADRVHATPEDMPEHTARLATVFK